MKTPAFWNEPSLAAQLLTPAAWAYRFGAWMDRACTTPRQAPLPVISIGNVTAGGAGKTPTALALAPLLAGIGQVPHILTRGYKAHATPTAEPVRADADWRSVGDEALLLARAAPTWVGRDRLASARAAQATGATVALCDDALQHHRLHKDISLLVIDGPFGLGNGCLLPAGPLREPFAAAVARCDAVILIGEDAQQLAARITLPIWHARLAPVIDEAALHAHDWVAFAGIGRPEKFFTTLRECGANLVGTHAFADHHAYSEAEMALLLAEADGRGARLITTEKDAVKLPPAWRAQISVLPVALTFDDTAAVADFLRARLAHVRA